MPKEGCADDAFCTCQEEREMYLPLLVPVHESLPGHYQIWKY